MTAAQNWAEPPQLDQVCAPLLYTRYNLPGEISRGAQEGGTPSSVADFPVPGASFGMLWLGPLLLGVTNLARGAGSSGAACCSGRRPSGATMGVQRHTHAPRRPCWWIAWIDSDPRQGRANRLMHLDGPSVPSRLPIADLENFAARRVESAWLAETGAAPRIGVFRRTGKI
eukprot:COSAG01_NODE_544_length_15682_cov_107.959379_2_plen_171_part_00